MNTGLEKDEMIQFDHRYRDALVLHLGKRRRQYVSKAGRMLGRDAFSKGITIGEIVRTHGKAMNQSLLSHSGNSKLEDQFLERTNAFLLEVISVIETKTLGQLSSLNSSNQKLHEQLKEETNRCSQLVTQSKILERQSRKLAHKFIQAQEEERKQISRDLHDQVAQTLASINVRLAMLKEMSIQDSRSFRLKIGQTQKMVEHSVRIVHLFARKLRPAMLDDLGLTASLRSLFEEITNREQLDIQFSAYQGVESLSNQHQTVLYRVVQESLTNVIRHAQAHTVRISLTHDADAIHLEVVDDGKSFQVESFLSSDRGKRLGLLGMRERVEMIGGQFYVISIRGKGTSIKVDIPNAISDK